MTKPVLRFMENNDLPRFINTHTLAQTKMAAALMFALPGMPMLFNGQEVGSTYHPYSGKSIFTANNTIKNTDSLGLFSYYQHLIALRKENPALSQSNINEIQVSKSNSVVAFHRWANNKHFLIVINVNAAAAVAAIDLRQLAFNQKTRQLTDVLTNGDFLSKCMLEE
ncbi:MAG: DUF3459 domain-containing protein [Sphingobacteriales bacterium]|nr:MAG: DUF3459 domain-containing protein [Sphingobacteriales bacterium]